MFDSLVTALPHVKDSKLLAATMATETNVMQSTPSPELLTIADVLQGLESVIWVGLYGPKALASDVVQKLNAALNSALADDNVKEPDTASKSTRSKRPPAPCQLYLSASQKNERAK
jgi:tripartite-type tricarboxylate transporter receptor subunit TctC